MKATIALTIVAAVAFAAADCAFAQLCAVPKPGLSAGEPNVEGHPLSFTASGKRYLLDIYSKFEPVADKSYCILYEAENKTDVVAKFYWETAGFDEPRLSVGRHSIFRKIPPGRPPIVNDTTLYAFTSTKMESFAFSRTVQKVSDVGQFTTPTPASFDNAARVRLVDVLESGDIGASYQGPTFELTARSYVKGTTDKFFIAFRIEAGMTVKGVRAPYANLLNKMPRSPSAAQIASSSLNEFEQLPLEKVDRSFFTGAPFAGKETDWLYVVEHPLFIEHDGGVTCLSTLAYSTAPMSPGLGCRLFFK